MDKHLKGLISYWGRVPLDEDVSGTIELKSITQFYEIAKKSRKILEVGVGKGRMIRALKKEGVNADFYSIDIIAKNLKSVEVLSIGV